MKKIKLESSKFVFMCVIKHIEICKEDIEKYKQRNIQSEVQYYTGMLRGLEHALYHLTGKNFTENELKELIKLDSNELLECIEKEK